MLYLVTSALALFDARSAVLSSSARAPPAMMSASMPLWGGMARNDLMGQQFAGHDDGHMAITMAGEETATALYGMVVPTTAPKPAEKNPLRPKYNGMGRNDMMGSATNNEEHMAITIVPVEGETAAAPAPTAAPAVETSAPVTETEVLAAQKLWAESIASISKVFADGGDFVGAAGEAAGKLYGYGKSNVLFKPTKATNNPFRPDADSAMSYFVGSKAMNNPKFDGEDAGFAINGGKGWKSVTFRNHQIELVGGAAIAMGDYIFVDATSGDEVRVEYTFGYKRNDDGKVRIFLHHSSVPYAA